MTDADFLSITHNGKLCDDEGGLGEHAFELVMREQVARPSAIRFSSEMSRVDRSSDPNPRFEVLDHGMLS
jgi:hypothetical protein